MWAKVGFAQGFRPDNGVQGVNCKCVRARLCRKQRDRQQSLSFFCPLSYELRPFPLTHLFHANVEFTLPSPHRRELF